MTSSWPFHDLFMTFSCHCRAWSWRPLHSPLAGPQSRSRPSPSRYDAVGDNHTERADTQTHTHIHTDTHTHTHSHQSLSPMYRRRSPWCVLRWSRSHTKICPSWRLVWGACIRWEWHHLSHDLSHDLSHHLSHYLSVSSVRKTKRVILGGCIWKLYEVIYS